MIKNLGDLMPLLENAVHELEPFVVEAPQGPLQGCHELEGYASLLATNQVLVFRALMRIVEEVQKQGSMLQKLSGLVYAITLYPPEA